MDWMVCASSVTSHCSSVLFCGVYWTEISGIEPITCAVVGSLHGIPFIQCLSGAVCSWVIPVPWHWEALWLVQPI